MVWRVRPKRERAPKKMQSKEGVRFDGLSSAEFRQRTGIEFDEFLPQALSKAREAQKNAYAPYSDFHVGAALLVEDRQFFCGANVENASYGATLCAERNAGAAAVSQGHRKFVALAVAGAPPCGLCRQFLVEFNAQLPVVFTSGPDVILTSLDRLLPAAFGPASLHK